MTIARWIAGLLGVLGLMIFATNVFAQTTAKADVSWTDLASEHSYTVEKSVDGGVFATVGTTAADVTTFTDDGNGAGLALGSQYCYRVFGSNAFGDGTVSAEACATPTTPGQVIGVQVIVSPL